jgi:hypothetical protein
MKFSSLVIVTACAWATCASAAAPSPTLSTPPSCKLIDAAISSTEDFAEIAQGTDPAAIETARSAIQTALDRVRPVLDQKIASAIASSLATVMAADKNGDVSQSAVASMDIYKLLVQQFEPRLPTTRSVAMLDYAGFKLSALLMSPQPDWAAVSALVQEASHNWTTARAELKDKALVDIGTSIHMGLQEASTKKNVDWLRSLAKMQLDSVDLLERVIKNKTKGACS